MKPLTIPNAFQAQAGPIPLAQLDSDFTATAAVVNDLGTYSNYLVDTGTVNVLVVTIPVGTTFVLQAGVLLQIQVSITTTSTTPTLNVSGSGAKPIVNADGTALITGQLVLGQILGFIYDGTSYRVMNTIGGVGLLTRLTVGAPASGAPVTINSIAGGTVINAGDGSVFWQINTNGGTLQFGTSSAAAVAIFTNNVQRLVLFADGGVTIGSPTGGSKGAGTLNVQNGIWVNGVAVTVP